MFDEWYVKLGLFAVFIIACLVILPIVTTTSAIKRNPTSVIQYGDAIDNYIYIARESPTTIYAINVADSKLYKLTVAENYSTQNFYTRLKIYYTEDSNHRTDILNVVAVEQVSDTTTTVQDLLATEQTK